MIKKIAIALTIIFVLVCGCTSNQYTTVPVGQTVVPTESSVWNATTATQEPIATTIAPVSTTIVDAPTVLLPTPTTTASPWVYVRCTDFMQVVNKSNNQILVTHEDPSINSITPSQTTCIGGYDAGGFCAGGFETNPLADKVINLNKATYNNVSVGDFIPVANMTDAPESYGYVQYDTLYYEGMDTCKIYNECYGNGYGCNQPFAQQSEIINVVPKAFPGTQGLNIPA